MQPRQHHSNDPYLTLEDGTHSARLIPLNQERTVIGREVGDVLFDDLTVSRPHAEITNVGRRHVVKDIDSKNGTYVNGARLPKSGSRTLKNGDRVSIGPYDFYFHDPLSTIIESLPRGLELDDQRGEVRVGGELVKLAPQEYVLLRMLFRQPGFICERDAIAKEVWPEYQGQVSDYNIDNLVARLRQKVERNRTAGVRIEAIKKRGYRLLLGDSR